MISRIGLVVHGGRPEAVAAAARVREWAASCCTGGCVDIDVWSDDPARPRRTAEDEAAAAGYPDLVVTVGGDGTLLRGVRIAAPLGIPVLGINCGRIGFLTEAESGEIDAALDAVNAGGAPGRPGWVGVGCGGVACGVGAATRSGIQPRLAQKPHWLIKSISPHNNGAISLPTKGHGQVAAR